MAENIRPDLIELVTFRVEGTPKPQPRTRRSQWGGVHTPATAIGWRERLYVAALPHRPAEPMIGAVEAELRFQFLRPKSHFTARGLLKAKHNVRHLSRPDLDNLEKAVLDELQDMGFYRNDSQVWAVSKSKVWICTGHSGLDVTLRFG